MPDNTTTAPRSTGLFERHFQTVLLALITTVIIWASTSLVDVRDKMIRMEERNVIQTNTLQQHQDDLNKMRMDIGDIKQDVHDLKRPK